MTTLTYHPVHHSGYHRRVRAAVVTSIAAICLVVPATASSRPLTMRAAERSIDLAFYAELAGDVAGGKSELAARVKAAKASDETAPRKRIEAWLESLERRTKAFSEHGRTARGYAAAFRTLEEFGAERQQLFWDHAAKDLQGLEVVPVRIVVDRIKGSKLDPTATLAQLVARRGVPVVEDGSILVRFELDATEHAKVGYRHRVVCKSSFVVRDANRDTMVGAYARRRTEERRSLADARRFAIRRALEDASRSVAFHGRLAALERRATPLR